MKQFKLIATLATTLVAGSAMADTLKIGYLTARTGAYVSLAETNTIAAELAVEEINAAGGVNGQLLELVTFDTAGRPEQAALGLRGLVRDSNVLAIVGPFSSNECQVVFPLGDREQIVSMSMGSSAPGLAKPYDFAFRNTMNEVTLIQAAVAALQAKEPIETAAIAHATDDAISLAVGTKILPMVLGGAEIEITKVVDFRLAAFDLAPQVTSLIQNPTDIVALGAFPEQAVRLVQEMRQQGHEGRLVSGSMIFDVTLPARMGPDGEGTISSTAFWWNADDRARSFTEAFRERAKAEGSSRIDPSQFDAATYGILWIYASAMAQAGVTGKVESLINERVAIRDVLASGRSFETAEGSITFDSDGDALKSATALEIRNGTWQPISAD